MPQIEQRKGSERTFRLVLDKLDQGWSTRSFPHLISERQLYVADNVIFNRDGLISKRPGNAYYGGSTTGATGSGAPVISGTRFYVPGQPPQLLVQSGGHLYTGNDSTGVFTSIGSGFSTTTPCTYAQVYDPDMSTGAAVALVICDGARIPYLWDQTHLVAVQTGTPYLPNNTVTNVPLTPRYVQNWKYHLCYAGDPNDPYALYIGDALRPERFTGISLTDSTGAQFAPYYPAGRGADLGVITGIEVINATIVVFYTAGIVVGYNTGTYGAYEFEWNIISTEIGCTAPLSITAFGGYIGFFGGDRFYATDGNTVVPIPDEIPSVYANGQRSTFPSEIKNVTTVTGSRRGLQYLASYDNVGSGPQNSVVCFDVSANGGWTYGAPTGGAWSRFPSGMPMAFGIEGRGPGETDFPFFWGSSTSDLVAQWDVGTYSDFGAPILMEVRGKAFFLDRPNAPKRVKYMDVVLAFPVPFGTTTGTYVDTLNAYMFLDSAQVVAPAVMVTVSSGSVFYNGATIMDGSVTYGQSVGTLTIVQRAWVHQDAIGYIFQPGLTEFSTNPCNIIALVIEVEIREPAK